MDAQGLVENRGPQLKLARPGGDLYRGQVQVQGVGNLMTHMAGCCRPLPGDSIAGFITQGRGVSIHRNDCARLLRLTGSSRSSAADCSAARRLVPVPLSRMASDSTAQLTSNVFE